MDQRPVQKDRRDFRLLVDPGKTYSNLFDALFACTALTLFMHSITAVIPNSGPTSGGAVITVLGQNLGPSKTMVFGKIGNTAGQISAFPTFEKLLLTIPDGVGGR